MNACRQNESLIKTIIHTTPVHQLTSGEDKKAEINPSLRRFQLQTSNRSNFIHNMAFSMEKSSAAELQSHFVFYCRVCNRRY